MPKKVRTTIGRHPRQYKKNKEIRRQKYRQAVSDKAAALVADLVIQRPFCTICKRFQGPGEEMNASVYENLDDSDIDDYYVPANNRGRIGTRWSTTQEASPVSGTEVLFKLFEILDMEFMAGNVCKDCTHLIQQLDGLKYQYECLKENLQNRVDKFFDKDINYKACLDTQLVAKAPTLADGKAFARSAVNKVMSSGLEGQGTQEDRVELENRITILSGPAMKGLGPAQALSHRRVANRSQANPDSYDYEMRPVGATGVVRPVNVQTGARLDEVQNNGHNRHSQTSRNPAHLKQTPNFRWEQWTDPRHVEHVMMRGMFDTAFVVNSGVKSGKPPTLLYNRQVYHSFLHHTQSAPTEVDSMVNRWICAESFSPHSLCPGFILTTVDNTKLLTESLADSSGMARCHCQAESSAESVHENFWGADIVTVMRNHPGLTDQEILDTCRLMMVFTPSDLTDSDQAMSQLVSDFRKNFMVKTQPRIY